MIERTPWLCIWMEACRFNSNPSASQHWFENAFEQFMVLEDAVGIFLSWSGIIESIVYAMEDIQPLDHWIRIFEDLLQKFRTFPSREIEIRVTCAMLHALFYRQPQHPEIESWANRAALFMENIPDMNARAQTMFQLVIYRILTGDFEKAALIVNEMDQLSNSEDTPDLAKLIIHLAKANYFQFTGRDKECMEAVSQGLELSKTSGVYIMENLLLYNGITSALHSNDLTGADAYLKKFEPSLETLPPAMRTFYYFAKSIKSILQKIFIKAEREAENAFNLAPSAGGPFHVMLLQLCLAIISHELGKHTEAERHLAHIFQTSEEIRSKLGKFYALMTKARFALDNGEEHIGLDALRDALALAKTYGYSNTMVDQPDVTARLCATALEHNIEVEYVQEIIRKRRLLPQDQPLHLENWPWPIRTYTLGRFGLVIDEEPIKFSRKAQQKPLSLLKTLITFGGREVKEDQLADAIWPDADGDTARQSCITTLHRLRKLIGNNEAILRRNGCLTLDQRYFWVDAWAFERLLSRSESAWKTDAKGGNHTEAVDLTQKAIEFYQGPFLNFDLMEPWAVSRRERLRSKFMRAVETLGNHWEKEGQLEKAVEWYRKSLEKDDLAETIYQRLMACHMKLGQTSDALRAYDRCRETLAASLGIEPSAETEALRKNPPGS